MNTALDWKNMLVAMGFLLGSCILSLILTRVCIAVLPRWKMIDIPHGRHQHARPVPRGGGVAIILSFVCTMAVVLLVGAGPLCWTEADTRHFLIQFMPPLLLIGVIGFLDDKHELRSLVKLIAQVIIGLYFFFTGAGISMVLGFHLPVWIALPVTVCWVIGVVNAFNLIDGMDGLAAGLASIAAFSIAAWAAITDGALLVVICMLVFCGSCLGFLKYNFAPAKIFMGDTGSLFIGLFFAYFSMAESVKAMTITSLLVPVLAMGIPIFDVFLAIVRRLFRKYVRKEAGVGIMTADHDHLHHRIMERMNDQKKTAYYLYLLAVLLVCGAITAALLIDLLNTLSFLVLLCIIFAVVQLATIEFYDAASLISEGIRVPHLRFLLTAAHPVTDVLFLLLAYVLTSIIFQRDIDFSPFTLKQALCYLAPFPVVLSLSGLYKTYWLRTSAARYYRLLLMLLLAAVIALGLALGFVLFEFGLDRDRISLMREFFTAYVWMGISFIFMERLTLHYLESYSISNLKRMTGAGRKTLSRTIVYGGGLYCRMFLTAEYSVSNEYPARNVIGIVDDNPTLRGLNVYGKNVIGTSLDLAALQEKYHFNEIVIALRNIPEETRLRIHEYGRTAGIRVLEFHYEVK